MNKYKYIIIIVIASLLVGFVIFMNYDKINNYVIIDKPISFIDFFRQDILWVLYPSLYHESDSNYVDSNYKLSINYLVDINSLNKLINKTDTDFSTKADSIKLYFDKEENLIRVSYGLDNYCRNNNICNSNLEIDLEKK